MVSAASASAVALGARISEAEIAQNNAIDAKLTKPADVKAEDVKVTDAVGVFLVEGVSAHDGARDGVG